MQLTRVGFDSRYPMGPGTAFYQQVVREQLEGVVAKRLTSR